MYFNHLTLIFTCTKSNGSPSPAAIPYSATFCPNLIESDQGWVQHPTQAGPPRSPPSKVGIEIDRNQGGCPHEARHIHYAQELWPMRLLCRLEQNKAAYRAGEEGCRFTEKWRLEVGEGPRECLAAACAQCPPSLRPGCVPAFCFHVGNSAIRLVLSLDNEVCRHPISMGPPFNSCKRATPHFCPN